MALEKIKKKIKKKLSKCPNQWTKWVYFVKENNIELFILIKLDKNADTLFGQ